MLADRLDYVVGVDPHRDSHALAVVHVVGGVVVFEATVVANSSGYAHALKLVDQHAAGRGAFAVAGTGSFVAGLTRFLIVRGEQVLAVGRLRRERRSGGKTDALDAVGAARGVLTGERPATARAGGERQALQALVAASGRFDTRLTHSRTWSPVTPPATLPPRNLLEAPLAGWWSSGAAAEASAPLGRSSYQGFQIGVNPGVPGVLPASGPPNAL
jgi:hypothetical protein